MDGDLDPGVWDGWMETLVYDLWSVTLTLTLVYGLWSVTWVCDLGWITGFMVYDPDTLDG